MAALNTFVYRHIPRSLRDARDFTGPMGWCWLMNQLLRRLESEQLVQLAQLYEVGVLVDNKYWVTPPSGFRNVQEVYFPGLQDYNPVRNIGHEIINGKIKLDKAIEIDDDDLDEFTLSAGSTTSVAINDTDAVANEWEESLLVLTDGTYSGDAIIIGEHDASGGVTTTLNFLHTRTTSISDSTAGYLTDLYAMLKYWGTFTGLSAQDDEIPVDDKYEMALVTGLYYLSKTIGSKERATARDEFEYELDLLKTEQFTPTLNQAKPDPRPMAALEDNSDFPYQRYPDFIGDLNAWAE